jgi:transposase
VQNTIVVNGNSMRAVLKECARDKEYKDAMRIYQGKGVVEKGFLRLKKSLDLGRSRIHNQLWFCCLKSTGLCLMRACIKTSP